MNYIKKHFLFIFLIIILLIIDRITKALVQTNLTSDEIIWLLKGFIGLSCRTNYGLNFGLGSNWRFIYPLNISFQIIFLLISFIYYIKLLPYLTNLLKVFFAFFMASNLGDLLELFRLGYRIDWIRVFNLFTTNLTDIYFFVSLGFLLVGLIKHPNIGRERLKDFWLHGSMKEILYPFRNDKKKVQ